MTAFGQNRNGRFAVLKANDLPSKSARGAPPFPWRHLRCLIPHAHLSRKHLQPQYGSEHPDNLDNAAEVLKSRFPLHQSMERNFSLSRQFVMSLSLSRLRPLIIPGCFRSNSCRIRGDNVSSISQSKVGYGRLARRHSR